jgi:hypothetical protein
VFLTLRLVEQGASNPPVNPPPALLQRFEFVSDNERGWVMRVVFVDPATEKPAGEPHLVGHYADDISIRNFQASTDQATASLLRSVLAQLAHSVTRFPTPLSFNPGSNRLA